MVSIIPSAAGVGGFEAHAETALITQEIPPGGGQFSITAMVFDQSATPNSRLEVHAWPETGLSLNTALPATPVIDPTLAQCGLNLGGGVPGDGGGASNLPDTPTIPNPPTRYPITQPPQTYDTYVSNVSTLVVTEVDGQQVYGFQLPGDLSEELFTAVFMGESAGTSRHVYLLESGETSTMATDVSGEELFPAPNPDNTQIAFLGIDQSGQTSLKIRSLANGWQVTLMTDSPQMTLAHIPMAWSPSSGTLLVTIMNANGIPGIYEFNLSDPASINMPTLLVENAAAPAIAQSGAFMAYVREADGASSIYARAVQSGRENPITVPEPGLLCQSPAFSKDANSLILFFVCQSDGQSTLYRYDQQGDQDMALDLGGINVQNPAPGPGLGFLAFDDGNSIYFLDDQGGNLTELLTLEGVQSTHIRWPSLPAQ
jgi:hypothetical protein